MLPRHDLSRPSHLTTAPEDINSLRCWEAGGNPRGMSRPFDCIQAHDAVDNLLIARKLRARRAAAGLAKDALVLLSGCLLFFPFPRPLENLQ